VIYIVHLVNRRKNKRKRGKDKREEKEKECGQARTSAKYRNPNCSVLTSLIDTLPPGDALFPPKKQ
jgi:hypothetical protein